MPGMPHIGEINRSDRAHELMSAPSIHPLHAHNASLVRERFYPAQLRRLLSPDLQSLAASRQHQLSWEGWDRSLPRLYLPVEPLMRLVVEAVDGITRQTIRQGIAVGSINVRVQWSSSSRSALCMAFDADRWECDARFRGALNARWFRQSSQAHLWQRLAKQSDLVGGWLSVNSLPGGGNSLVLSLPIDQPRALLHSWLNRQTTSSRSLNQLDRRESSGRLALSLYAIGRSQLEDIDQLRAANIRLQSLARNEDYIYRVSHGRWIWLTSQSELPAFVKTSAWQSQLLDRWNCATDSASIFDMASQLERRFHELIGGRVPPLDLRTHQASRGPITPRRPSTRVDLAAAAKPSHLNVRSHTQRPQTAKWRYPI